MLWNLEGVAWHAGKSAYMLLRTNRLIQSTTKFGGSLFLQVCRCASLSVVYTSMNQYYCLILPIGQGCSDLLVTSCCCRSAGRSLQLLRYRTVEDHPLRSFGPGSLKTLLPRGNGKQARSWEMLMAFMFADVYGICT